MTALRTVLFLFLAYKLDNSHVARNTTSATVLTSLGLVLNFNVTASVKVEMISKLNIVFYISPSFKKLMYTQVI